jgi:hypothetical protein
MTPRLGVVVPDPSPSPSPLSPLQQKFKSLQESKQAEIDRALHGRSATLPAPSTTLPAPSPEAPPADTSPPEARPSDRPVAFRPDIRDPETGEPIRKPGVAAAALPPFAEEQSAAIMAGGEERPALMGERMEVAASYTQPSSRPISREAVEEAAKVEWWAPIQNLEVFDYARRALWQGTAWAAQALPDEGTAAGDVLMDLVGATTALKGALDDRKPSSDGAPDLGGPLNLAMWALDQGTPEVVKAGIAAIPDMPTPDRMRPVIEAATRYADGNGSLSDVASAYAAAAYPEVVREGDYRTTIAKNLYRSAASGDLYQKGSERKGYIEWGLPFVEVTGESWRTPNMLGSDLLDAAVPPALAAEIRDKQDRTSVEGEAAWRYWDALTTDVGREVVGLGYEIAYDPMWFVGPAKGGQVVAKGANTYRLGRPVVRASGALARLGRMDADRAGRVMLDLAIGTEKEKEAAAAVVEAAARAADEAAAMALARAQDKGKIVGQANLGSFRSRMVDRVRGRSQRVVAEETGDIAAAAAEANRLLDEEYARLADLEEVYHLNPGSKGELAAVRDRIAAIRATGLADGNIAAIANSGRLDLVEARLLADESRRLRSAAKMAQNGEHVVKEGRLAVHVPFSDTTRFLVKGNSLVPEPLARQMTKVADLARPPSIEALAAKLAASPGAAAADVLSRGEQLAYAMHSVTGKVGLWSGFAYDWLASIFGSRWIQPKVAYLRTMAELEALGSRGRAVGAVSDRLGLRIVALRTLEPEVWNRYQAAVTKYMRALTVDEAHLLQRVRRLSREAERVARARREAALRGDEGANPAWAEPTYGGEQVMLEAGNAIETGAGLLDERPELRGFADIAKELVEYISATHGKDIEEVKQSLVAMQRWAQGNPTLMRQHQREMADLERHLELLSEAREEGKKAAEAAESAALRAAEEERKANHAAISSARTEEEGHIVEFGSLARQQLSEDLKKIRAKADEDVADIRAKARMMKELAEEAKSMVEKRKKEIAQEAKAAIVARKEGAASEIEQIKAGLKEAQERHNARLAAAAEAEAKAVKEAEAEYPRRLEAAAKQKVLQDDLREEMVRKFAELQVPKKKTKAAMADFLEKRKALRGSYESRIREAAELEKKLSDPRYIEVKKNEAILASKKAKKASASAVRAEKEGVKEQAAAARLRRDADIDAIRKERDAHIATATTAHEKVQADIKTGSAKLREAGKAARADAEAHASRHLEEQGTKIGELQAEARARLAERVEEQRSFTQDLAWSAKTRASAARHARLQQLDEAVAAGKEAVARRGEEIRAILKEVTPRLEPPEEFGKGRSLEAWEQELWSIWRQRTGQPGFDFSTATAERVVGPDKVEEIKVTVRPGDFDEFTTSFTEDLLADGSSAMLRGAGHSIRGVHDPADLLLAAFSALRESPSVPSQEFVKQMAGRYPQILGQRLGEMPDDLVPVAEEMGAIFKSYEALYEKHGMDFVKNPTRILKDWGVVGYVPHIEAPETIIARKGGGAAAVAEAKTIERSISTAMDSAKKRALKGSIAEINALTENSQLTLTLDPSAIVSRYIQANRAMAADDFLDALLEGGVLRVVEAADGRSISQVALDEDLVPLFETGGDHRQGDMMERLLEQTREQWEEAGFNPEQALEMLKKGSDGPLATWVGESKAVQQGVNLEKILGAVRASDFEKGVELTNPRRMQSVFVASGMTEEDAWKAVADYLNARSRAMGVGVQTSPGALARYYGEVGPTYRMYVPRAVQQSMHDIFEVETSLRKWAGESRAGEAVALGKAGFDQFNNWWKTRVTILATAFSTRNAVSNVVSNILDVGVHGALSIRTNLLSTTLATLAPYVDTYGGVDATVTALDRGRRAGEGAAAYARRKVERAALNQALSALLPIVGLGRVPEGSFKFGSLKLDLGDGVLRTLDEVFTLLREKQVIAPSYHQVVDLDRFSNEVAEMMLSAESPGLSWNKVKAGLSAAEDVALVALSTGVAGGVPVALPKGLGAAVSRVVENQARTTNFIANLRRSGNVEESAAHVQQFLFNYSDLTGVQRVWMRTLVPFFTWTQKNVALQLELMRTHPYLYAQYNRLMVDGLPRAAEAYNAHQRGESYYEPLPGRQYNLKARQPHTLGRIRMPLPGGEEGQYIEGFGTPQEALMEQVAMAGGIAEGVANTVALTGALGDTRQEMARLAQHEDKKPFLRFMAQTHLFIKLGAEIASQQSLFYDRPINKLNNGRLIGATMRGLREMPVVGPVFGGFLAESLGEAAGYTEIASSQYPNQAVVFAYSNYAYMNQPYSRIIRDSAAASDLYHTSMAAEILSGQPAEVHPLSPFWRYADAAAGIRVVTEDPALQRAVMQDRLNEGLSGYYESRGLTGSRKSEHIKKR